MSSLYIINNGSAIEINGNALDCEVINVKEDIYVGSMQPYLPVGSVLNYAGLVAPSGWLLCDGSAVNRELYGRLFSVISTVYGVGDGVSTFNLPNLSERVPVGKSLGVSVGDVGGNKLVTLSVGQLPSHGHSGVTASGGAHTHTITDPGHTHTQTTINDDFNNSRGNPPGFTADSAGTRVWNNISTAITGISINEGVHIHMRLQRIKWVIMSRLILEIRLL